MKRNNITLAFGLALAASQGIEGYRSLAGDTLNSTGALRRWALDMHRRQVELLKINWGGPGFCTEWDKGLDPGAQSCGKGGMLHRRSLQ